MIVAIDARDLSKEQKLYINKTFKEKLIFNYNYYTFNLDILVSVNCSSNKNILIYDKLVSFEELFSSLNKKIIYECW
jgi:hypothetical protein